MSLFTQIASGLCLVIYGSFFEWFWHKYWMHTPRPPREAFRGHTLVHHVLYRGDDSYYLPDGEDPKHILLKPYALPLIFLFHLPAILAIDRFVVPHTAIGAMVAIVLYFVVYEYMHWNMHVPRGHLVERFRWFQFLREHHLLHHRFMQRNFCVLFPLADWVFGTLVTEKSLAHRRALREQAIANGMPINETEPRSRRFKRLELNRRERRSKPAGRSEKSLLTLRFLKSEALRIHAMREQRQARKTVQAAESRTER
ncbi:MAG TPA: sterol desaturase family protein [Chthonomonadaceae bacterium]|nr:sterol desaturase family protein [Chthonomonadaceae bacterium]